ncbi:MAG: AraC family transcriptional regulator [Spirochaetia bacterium]|nr:AraC family transcriptional regulator [Spirochaetia bacterium]
MGKFKNGFLLTPMKTDIKVNYFITFHYFEYPKKFHFKGERHDFWELLYVDKGVVFVQTDTARHQLRQGQIIFHEPNEFHSVECDGLISPCLVVISFDTNSAKMKYFKNNILPINGRTKTLLSLIINEAKEVYATDFSDPYYKSLTLADNPPIGSQQLIKNYFEAFLIELLKQGEEGAKVPSTLSPIQSMDKKSRFELANTYLLENISNNITLDDVCNHSSMSKTLAQQIFRHETNHSVMGWYARLKMERAKQFIREGKGNVTTIAYELGYSSIHHFSKQFSHICGMSPKEYAHSIKSLLANTEDL